MAIVKQSTEKPLLGEIRLIKGTVKEWNGTQWVTFKHEPVKQPEPFNMVDYANKVLAGCVK